MERDQSDALRELGHHRLQRPGRHRAAGHDPAGLSLRRHECAVVRDLLAGRQLQLHQPRAGIEPAVVRADRQPVRQEAAICQWRRRVRRQQRDPRWYQRHVLRRAGPDVPCWVQDELLM